VAERMRLTALTPSETLIDTENVEWVHVALAGEEFLTIWPGHAPLLAETVAETVRYMDSTGEHELELLSGVLHVRDDVVSFFLTGVLGEGPEALAGSRERGPPERLDRLIAAISRAESAPAVP